MTTVGYGDIICISSIERIYHIILLTIGTILYTFLVSKIGNYLRDQSHEQIKLDNDLTILENIRVSYPTMPFNLYIKIKSHLLNISKKKKKAQLSLLINGVPETLKNDLLFKIYSKVINDFSIFKNVKNSNFILQILTSFIPIILKKEEILLSEGEFVENIIFVKNGRLSMEMTIDLNDPYKSIKRYLEINFIGISKKELNSNNNLSTINSIMNINRNYNDLKEEIDHFLLDKQKSLNINNSFNDNNISFNLGRFDFNKRESNLINSKNLEHIKIFDVRKNENFGVEYIFLKKPSPFTLKAKTRIVEVLLLRKHEAQIISNNFPNIWRNIHNKSYHNLISLKKLAFKTLKQYYNYHFYHKNGKDNNFSLSLENSDNDFSFLEKPKLHKKIFTNERLNLIKSNKNNDKNLNNSIKIIKSNEIVLDNESKGEDNKRKSIVKSLNNKFFITNDSIGSLNSQNFDNNESLVKQNTNFIPNYINNIHENNNLNKNINLLKRKNLENFVFRKQNDIINETINKKGYNSEKNYNIKSDSFKNEKNNTSIDYYKEIIKNINNSKIECNDIEILLNQTIEYDKKNEKNLNDNTNEKEKIFTLKDINNKISKKIRKKIKKRKKFERLQHSFELEKKENNKNLKALYYNIITEKLNPILNNNKENCVSESIKNNIAEELVNITLSKSNTLPISKLLDSTSSEEYIQNKFDKSLLIPIISESFEIKSSYKNINLLTKGQILKSSKYKKFIENFIKKNIKLNNFNDIEFKRIISKYSEKSRIHRNKKKNYNRSSTYKYLNNNTNFFDKRISSIPKDNFKNNTLLNNYTKKNTDLNISNHNLKNYFNTLKNNKKQNNEKINNFNKMKISRLPKTSIIIESEGNENNNTNEKNYNTEKSFIKEIKENRKIVKIKNKEKAKHLKIIGNSSINNNKSNISSLNFFNEIDKNKNSKSENELNILNKNNNFNNCSINIINKEIDNNKKSSKCIIF